MNRRERRAARIKAGGRPEWIPFARATLTPRTEAQIQEFIAHWKELQPEMSETEIRATLRDIEENDEIWKNNIYQVNIRALGDSQPRGLPPMVQLSIKRIDQKPIHDWRDLQRIKSELVGSECEGVELYPAESRVVDTANQYFIHVVINPTFRFPWGFKERLVDGKGGGGAVQRPL
jgi:hypothetical protein